MTWNYRVLHRPEDSLTMWQVIEAYYDDDGSIEGWCEAAALIGLDLDDLANEARAQLAAIEAAIADLSLVLTPDDLPPAPGSAASSPSTPSTPTSTTSTDSNAP
ncbi:MAG TPA: hypothetical protein VM328_10990 [Fimbriimonadaceae bacterium]|nr:hypothetical protein [Fimbriimonadaceae bacterium]